MDRWDAAQKAAKEETAAATVRAFSLCNFGSSCALLSSTVRTGWACQQRGRHFKRARGRAC